MTSLHLTDPRDQALFAAAPMLTVPRFGELPALESGYRFLAAQDGIYLEARTKALHAVVSLVEVALPYGPLEETLSLTNGLLPDYLYHHLAGAAVHRCPSEWAAIVSVTPEKSWKVHTPQVIDAGAGHISYRNVDVPEDEILLDIHSHGAGEAFFSATDDHSDRRGIHLSTVLGRCGSIETVTAKTRLCVHGRFFDLEWNPW